MSLGLLIAYCAFIAILTKEQQEQSRVVRAALRQADLPLEKAALHAECDARQLAREIDGETGTLRKLWKLPDQFKAWLGVTLVQAYGIPEEAMTAVRLHEHGLTRTVTLPLSTHERKVS